MASKAPFSRNRTRVALFAGILGIIVLALLFDTFFNLLGKLTTSRGIRD